MLHVGFIHISGIGEGGVVKCGPQEVMINPLMLKSFSINCRLDLKCF